MLRSPAWTGDEASTVVAGAAASSPGLNPGGFGMKDSVSKDGQRFLVITPAEERIWRFNVVLNGPALLKE